MTTASLPTAPGPHITTERRMADTVRRFPAVLRSELIKASTLRSNKFILVGSAAISFGITWAAAHFVTDEVLTTAELFTFTTVFSAVFAAVAGILLFTSETSHGTLAPSVSAQPVRALLAAAKTVTAGGFGIILGLAGMGAAIAGSIVGGVDWGDGSSMAADGGRALLFTALASILGLGLGMITRHSAAAVSGLLVWWLVLENLIIAFANENVSRFLPFAAGNALVDVTSGDEFATVGLTHIQATLVFGGYALGAIALGTFLLQRRDA